MFSEIFKPKMKVSQPQDNWADVELNRLAEDLKEKRKAAIDYLGDKWILKGGEYTRSNITLGQK